MWMESCFIIFYRLDDVITQAGDYNYIRLAVKMGLHNHLGYWKR